MLTTEGFNERKWGPFPMLRRILETRRLPDSYFGPTSVSDNIFDSLHRTLEISLLACECETEIRNTARAGGLNEIISDLRNLESALRFAGSFIDQTSARVEHLYRTL